jgi:hypothetical protein
MDRRRRQQHPRRAESGGLLLQPQVDGRFIALNRLLAAGEEVTWLNDGPWDRAPSSPTSRRRLAVLRRRRLISASWWNATAPLAAQARKLRIGLYDTYGHHAVG